MTEFCKRCKQPKAHPFHAPKGLFGREMETHEYEPWDSRNVRLSDPSTWEPLTPTPKIALESVFTCNRCGAKGDPPRCEHFQQAWRMQEIADAHQKLSQVTWMDLRKQAVHCPMLAAMFEMSRQGVWATPEDGLLWVALMLSEGRIQALNEHAQTLMRSPR